MQFLGALIVFLANGCSSVFYSHDGEFAYGLTAAHCIKGDTVEAVHDGHRFGCRVLCVDRDRDIALIKCYREFVGNVSCPVVSPRAGAEIVAIGFPRGKLTRTAGVLRSGFVPGTRSTFFGGTRDIAPGFSGGGVFVEDGLIGVVTHSAEVAGEAGGGCSIVDKIIDRSADRVVGKSAEIASDTFSLNLRDFVLALIGYIGRFYFPGSSMMTATQHKERVAELTKS